MIGVIAGDVVGSVYERRPTKSVDCPLFQERSRFTDDTVMTVATARAILEGVPYDRVYRELGQRYPNAGYGGSFYAWLFEEDSQPYNSWGNGSAMRGAPVGLAFESVDDVLREAERSAAVTHDHPEGVKGAQAIRLAISLGGDSDTQAAIAGGIAHAFHGSVPEPIGRGVRDRLPAEFIEVIDAFSRAYPVAR
jgi:ADP-ribosylglycohydrolase